MSDPCRMTSCEFRAIRQGLGLTLDQMGAPLGYDANEVSRRERDRSLKSARQIDARLGQLMDAYRSGYQPVEGYKMSNEEFRATRQSFGFTLEQMGRVLGLTFNQVSRLERDPKLKSSRPIDTQLAQLMDAYRRGYRPPHWPRTG